MSSKYFAATLALLAVSIPAVASALPESHLLRIDPRGGVNESSPVLTTLLEIGEFKTVSDALSECSNIRSEDAYNDCVGNAMEKPGALWTAFKFPEGAAKLAVRVDSVDQPATFVSKAAWKDVQKDPGMGTAWLVALDASNGMGSRYGDAREVAFEFLKSMAPNDLMRVVIFDDRAQAYTADSKWQSFANRAAVKTVLDNTTSAAPSSSSGKPLFDIVKNVIKSGFNDLGNTGSTLTIPIHQSFVLLSNGAGRNDAITGSAAAEQLKQYASKGRFPEENTASPKTPLPIVSVLFPNPKGGLMNGTYATNDALFMQSLANPEIGGYFSVVRGGQGAARGSSVVKAIRNRFNNMWIVKWRLSCLSPTVEQSFTLGFTSKTPVIKPDGTFKEVPIGVDPSQWPLDIDVAATKAEADKKPLHPGGTFKVYGNFCWGSAKERAEAFFVPAGTRPDPNQNKGDIDAAKKAMQNLVAQNMRGAAVEANATFVELQVPDDEKVLEGTGDNLISRVVLFDNRANRASGTDEKTVLTLRAEKKPLPVLIIALIGGGVVVIGLLLAVLLKGGGGNNKRRGGGGGGGGNAPQPVVAGGGYGGPPGPPPGGGYGAPPGGYGAPPGGGYGPPGGGYGGPQQYGSSVGAAWQAKEVGLAPGAFPRDASVRAPHTSA
jgi:hypothetical protein